MADLSLALSANARLRKSATEATRLRAEVQRLREWLTDLQWVQPMYNGEPSCINCGVNKHLHDNKECSLARSISAWGTAERSPWVPVTVTGEEDTGEGDGT